MISKDLFLDSNNDLTIQNGDWAILQSDDQNIQAIIQASKGQFYQYPLLGYGITARLNSPVQKAKEKRDIRQEMNRDNYNVFTLIIENDFTITIDANKTK
jgi:hypothetical protein